ncbi:MAG: hypothetical protein OEW42_12270 [Acidimicrobiia bacterium]|nr:hypothetical protein [Acidimicrobiia bacterium]MDH5236104.1 hypothetical protein [Acidimicrobiia bacterium]
MEPAWSDRYFTWLDRECDADTGLWRRGHLDPAPGWTTRFPQLAGTFHYLFNYQHAGRPHPHPEALAATACAQIVDQAFPWGHFAGFAEIDAIYCARRATLDAGLATDRLMEILSALSDRIVGSITTLALDDADGAGDLHLLFGSVCALAELQAALPETLSSEQPLRLVLDRRPFI